MLVRLALILITPPFLAFVFFAELIRYSFRAFGYAFLECCIEFAVIRRAWRNKSFNIRK